MKLDFLLKSFKLDLPVPNWPGDFVHFVTSPWLWFELYGRRH
jgi:hypothetical protein